MVCLSEHCNSSSSGGVSKPLDTFEFISQRFSPDISEGLCRFGMLKEHYIDG